MSTFQLILKIAHVAVALYVVYRMVMFGYLLVRIIMAIVKTLRSKPGHEVKIAQLHKFKTQEGIIAVRDIPTRKRHPLPQCPECGKVVFSSMPGEPYYPMAPPGTVHICGACSHVSEVIPGNKLRLITETEILSLSITNPELYRMITGMRSFGQKINTKKFNPCLN